MSDVWEFFQRVKNDENVVLSINCQLFEAVYGISTSTTTLCCHLLGTHSTIYTSENKQQRQIIPYTSAEQKHITVKLTQWISVNLQPFSIVNWNPLCKFY